jgi:hypothetical protein
LLVATGAASRAYAYDFSIDLRTIGQGYQVRGFAPDGTNELLSRRRLTQYLDVNVFDIEPSRWHGDDGGRNIIYFDASLRFDSDFGGYMLARPTGVDEIRELEQNQVDILYAFVGGRNIGGRLDFQLGRQVHFDLVDFYSYDGGDAVMHLRRGLSVEAFGGTEVRGDLPLASPIYELDGTSAGSRDPATLPGQASALRPLVGAAVAVGGDGRPWTLRLAYRRVWSSTTDPFPGEPTSGVNDEKLGLTGNLGWHDRFVVMGGARFNVLLGTFDDQQLTFRVRLRRTQWLTLDYAYLAPSFDGDSIWNVFATGPYRDLRASWEIGLSPELKAYARSFVRLFSATDEVAATGPYAGQDVGALGPGGRLALGGSLGAAWRRGRGFLRGDGYADGGYGGLKVGVDLTGRWMLQPAFELEGRLSSYLWRSDLNTTNDHGFVFGAQAGGRYVLGPGVRLHLLLEDNVGTFYAAQFRGLAVLEMAASI